MTHSILFLRRAIGALLLAALPLAAFAHEGHEPGDEPPPRPIDAATPRFAASSALFELVGALEGRRLTLWLDRFADNAPVEGARIEIEVGEHTLVARPDGDRYLAELPAAPAPGALPVTATVVAGGDSDLLAAELVVAPAGAVATRRPAPGSPASGLAASGFAAGAAIPAWWVAGIAAISALLAGALGWAAGRRRSRVDTGRTR